MACEVARDGFEATGTKSRSFDDFKYAARTWRRRRRVIARIEHTAMGRNLRFIVTNLDGEADELPDRMYCQRADMENRIKERQLALFADRTSSSKWWTNQYRLLLAGMAYTLLETMRRTALRGTGLARSRGMEPTGHRSNVRAFSARRTSEIGSASLRSLSPAR